MYPSATCNLEATALKLTSNICYVCSRLRASQASPWIGHHLRGLSNRLDTLPNQYRTDNRNQNGDSRQDPFFPRQMLARDQVHARDEFLDVFVIAHHRNQADDDTRTFPDVLELQRQPTVWIHKFIGLFRAYEYKLQPSRAGSTEPKRKNGYMQVRANM